MRQEAEGPERRRRALSVRALLFGAILLAGAPGVVFGAMLAWHAYQTSSIQETAVRLDDAVRVSVRLEDAMRATQERAAAIAIADAILAPSCRSFYTNVVGIQTLFSAVGRVDARGRLVCITGATRSGLDFSEADWFQAIKAGAAGVETGIRATPFDAQPVLIVAHRIEVEGRFQGAAFLTVPRSYFSAMLAEDVGPSAGGVAIFDKTGAAISMLLRETDSGAGLAVAKAVLGSRTGLAIAQGLSGQRVARPSGAFSVISITPRAKQAELGVRAALIVLAPLLVAALMVIAMSAAMHRWVLRWFARLKEAAEDYALGRYAPAPMEGAPAEIATLASALDTAVAQSRAREQEVAAALAANVSLTRELHHRVKNNLQVLSSLISRQQRRAGGPAVREALSEARARMAPVALAYRFIHPPEERVVIDVNAYLEELAQQLHAALGGPGRGMTLQVSARSEPLLVDDAINLGLIAAEAFVCGYANAAERGVAHLSFSTRPDGDHELFVDITPGESRIELDRELVRELARQLHGEILPNAHRVTLVMPAKQT